VSRPPSFRLEPRDLGALRPGLSLDSVSELMDLAEGPEARDANVLLYAYHPRAAQHERCRTWVEVEFASGAAVRIPGRPSSPSCASARNPRVFEFPGFHTVNPLEG
jgi:hypothetical protein